MEKIVPMQLIEVQKAALTILGRICTYFTERPNPNVLFFLKGGMAYDILRQGNTLPLTIDPHAGNDFDTILLINPELGPAEFNALLAELREVIFHISKDTISDEPLRGHVLGELDARGIPLGTPVIPGYDHDTHPFLISKIDSYKDMNLSLISIFLNTRLIPEKPYYYTKLIDISIPHRHYNLLQFDYALYRMPGRVISKTIDGHTIFIADFLSILFDQSVTKTLNKNAVANKKERRAARIRMLRNRSNKNNRNAIVNTIEPYVSNNVLNGFVTNEVISRYTKGRAKAPAILPSSSSSPASITVAEAAARLASASAPEIKGPSGIQKESLTAFQALLLQKKAASNAAKAAAAAKGTT